MNSNKYTHNKTISSNHKHYILLLASYGIAHRGGVKHSTNHSFHSKRLVSNINILSSQENKHLIFSETIFSN